MHVSPQGGARTDRHRGTRGSRRSRRLGGGRRAGPQKSRLSRQGLRCAFPHNCLVLTLGEYDEPSGVQSGLM